MVIMRRDLKVWENWFSVNEEWMRSNQATRKMVRFCDFVEEVRRIKRYVPKAQRLNPEVKYRFERIARRLIWTTKIWTVPTENVVWSINGKEVSLPEVFDVFKWEEGTCEARDSEVSVMETKNSLTKQTTRWLMLYHDYERYSYRGEFEMTDTNVCLYL